jgi:hypothetical protein
MVESGIPAKASATAAPTGEVRGHRSQPSAEKSFASWAFSAVEKVRKTIGIGSVVASTVAIISLRPIDWLQKTELGLEKHLNEIAPQRAALFFVQAVTCLLLAALTPRPQLRLLKERNPDLSPERELLADKVCRRVQLNLIAVFILWCAYYMISGIGLLIGPNELDQAFTLSLSGITALFVFWLYLELAELTVASDIREAPGTSDAMRHRILSCGILVLLLVLIWYAFGRGASTVATIVDIAIGFMSGISLCLVVGVLGSKWLDPGPITLALLYFYAVIQPLAFLFSRNPVVYLLATSIALPLKILLWLVCVWASTSGVLAEYVYEARVILEEVGQRREEATDG